MHEDITEVTKRRALTIQNSCLSIASICSRPTWWNR